MTWMLIRLVLSLAFVGLVLWFAARVAKKRGIGGGGAHGLIEVVARQRMGRSSSVNVVRIGDVVLVVGATEEQITLLAEVDNETIDAALHEREDGRPARLPAARAPRPAPAAAPQRYASDGYDAHGYEEPAYPSRGNERQAYDGDRYADHGRERYAAEGYAAEGYAGDGYADEGYAVESYAAERHPAERHPAESYAAEGYAEHPDRGHEGRRAGGQHADHRYGGGGHRPVPAPSSGALAGSVFDKNGWGTFVNELRERTVRRP